MRPHRCGCLAGRQRLRLRTPVIICVRLVPGHQAGPVLPAPLLAAGRCGRARAAAPTAPPARRRPRGGTSRSDGRLLWQSRGSRGAHGGGLLACRATQLMPCISAYQSTSERGTAVESPGLAPSLCNISQLLCPPAPRASCAERRRWLAGNRGRSRRCCASCTRSSAQNTEVACELTSALC